jgi:4-diphosphocytidyl-2-C-methyl-D-erythritol kinase
MDQMERMPTLGIQALREALTTGDPRALASALHNDTQDAAVKLQPSLAETLRKGEEAGALKAIVSGSGPTCAFLCADESTALKVAAEFERSAVAQGPAAGAYLVPQS